MISSYLPAPLLYFCFICKVNTTFVLKNYINSALAGLGAEASSICWCLWNKICMKYIWVDWGVFTCFSNSRYSLWVQGNKVSVCVSLSVCKCTVCVCVCVAGDDAWLAWNPIICSGMFKPKDGEEMQRDGWEEDEKLRSKEEEKNNSRQWSLGQWCRVPAVMRRLWHKEKSPLLTYQQTSTFFSTLQTA